MMFVFIFSLAKKLLLLDLDETLIHSEQLPMGAEPGEDHCFAIDIPLLDDSGEIEVSFYHKKAIHRSDIERKRLDY